MTSTHTPRKSMTDFIIREAHTEDDQRLAEIYNHYVVNTHFTFDVEPVSAASRREWLTQYNNNELHRLFVGVVNNEVVGFAASKPFRQKPAYYRSVETTIYLAPNNIGNSLGRLLYQHLLDQLRNTDVKRCYGIIALPNDASVALHLSLGYLEAGHFSEVGFKFNKFWDTLWMELSL